MRLLAIGVTQDSGAARALCGGVQLALAEGELHALLGADGAGKSALLQILGGVRRPGRGLLLLDGQPYAPASPGDARRAGVWTAGRGATLADGLTVEENLSLGAEPSRRGWIDRDLRLSLAWKALGELPGSAIPPRVLAGALSVADRRRVEIGRALLAPPKVLLVEVPEPYAPAAFAPFFAALRRLATRGTAILYATRSLEAARDLCTRYTLLREEGTVASGRLREESLEAYEESPLPRLPRRMGRALLQRGDGLVVHEGEIVGLLGGDGLDRPRFGRSATYGGRILLGMTIADNLTLPFLRRFSQWGFLSLSFQDATALHWMEKLHLRARTPRQEAGELSTTDRQKILLGRLLLAPAPVLVLEAPTRGLAGSVKRQIHALLQSIAAEGRGLLIASADPAELLGLCDTIALARRGRPLECRPAARWTERELAAVLLDPANLRREERSLP